MRSNIAKIREIITRNKSLLAQTYKIKNIGIFGSYARGDIHKGSDIDILVDFYEVPDLFEFIRLEYFLRKLLGRKVDLVTRNALKPIIKRSILRETIYL